MPCIDEGGRGTTQSVVRWRPPQLVKIRYLSEQEARVMWFRLLHLKQQRARVSSDSFSSVDTWSWQLWTSCSVEPQSILVKAWS